MTSSRPILCLLQLSSASKLWFSWDQSLTSLECGNVLLMEALKSWLLIGRANLISINGLSFTFWSQAFWLSRRDRELLIHGIPPEFRFIRFGNCHEIHLHCGMICKKNGAIHDPRRTFGGRAVDCCWVQELTHVVMVFRCCSAIHPISMQSFQSTCNPFLTCNRDVIQTDCGKHPRIVSKFCSCWWIFWSGMACKNDHRIVWMLIEALRHGVNPPQSGGLCLNQRVMVRLALEFAEWLWIALWIRELPQNYKIVPLGWWDETIAIASCDLIAVLRLTGFAWIGCKH